MKVEIEDIHELLLEINSKLDYLEDIVQLLKEPEDTDESEVEVTKENG